MIPIRLRRSTPLGLLLAGVLTLIGSAPAWTQGAGTAMLISVEGAASVRRSGSAAFVDAYRKMALATGDIVRTGPNGRASLLFADGSQVKLNINTVLLIPAAPAHGVPSRLGLRAGEIWARITRGRHVSIETPAAVAGVRGTELDLQLAADETATLTVVEGEVQFSNARGSVLVRDAQQSIARPGQAPTAPAVANVPFIMEWTNDVQPVVLLLETAFVSQDPTRLAAALQELERERDENAERRRRLGDVRHDRGELREALAAYEAARERLGPAAPAAQRAQIEGRIGQTLLELGKLPEAEAAFRTSLALDPSGGAPDEAPEALPRSLAPSLPRSLARALPAPAWSWLY